MGGQILRSLVRRLPAGQCLSLTVHCYFHCLSLDLPLPILQVAPWFKEAVRRNASFSLPFLVFSSPTFLVFPPRNAWAFLRQATAFPDGSVRFGAVDMDGDAGDYGRDLGVDGLPHIMAFAVGGGDPIGMAGLGGTESIILFAKGQLSAGANAVGDGGGGGGRPHIVKCDPDGPFGSCGASSSFDSESTCTGDNMLEVDGVWCCTQVACCKTKGRSPPPSSTHRPPPGGGGGGRGGTGSQNNQNDGGYRGIALERAFQLRAISLEEFQAASGRLKEEAAAAVEAAAAAAAVARGLMDDQGQADCPSALECGPCRAMGCAWCIAGRCAPPTHTHTPYHHRHHHHHHHHQNHINISSIGRCNLTLSSG